MKKIFKIVALVGCFTLFVSAERPAKMEVGSSSYDIAGIYEKIELKSGAKVIDAMGSVSDASAVLVPTKVDEGKYEVELTRIDKDFYQICGTSLYIETKYCYEYATWDDAILNITSNYGYTRGEVIFLD
jgi:hypothetical protein